MCCLRERNVDERGGEGVSVCRKMKKSQKRRICRFRFDGQETRLLESRFQQKEKEGGGLSEVIYQSLEHLSVVLTYKDLVSVLVGMGRWSSPFLGIAVSVALISLLLFTFFRSPPTPAPSSRLFTVEELAIYNGTDHHLPILLAILGSVFDVTKGKTHYGEGGGYNHFAGRDASRAFVSGNFSGDGLTDSLLGLSSTEVKSIVDWREFYFKTYIFLGKLVGRYYDSVGNPTKYLKGVEAKAARGAQLMEKQKMEEAKQPSCNSRWSQDEGSEVWCDNGYPRLVQRPLEIALTGKMSKRCVCFNEEELGQQGLEVYGGCDYFAKLCRL